VGVPSSCLGLQGTENGFSGPVLGCWGQLARMILGFVQEVMGGMEKKCIAYCPGYEPLMRTTTKDKLVSAQRLILLLKQFQKLNGL